MSARTYAIPAVLPALSLLAACTPTIMGEWELVELDGDDFGEAETYSYGGCQVSYSYGVTVTIDDRDGDKFEGEIESSYSVVFSGDCNGYTGYSDTYDYDVEAELNDDKEWEVEVDDLNMDLVCTIEGDEMDCEDEDTNVDYLFERQG